VARLAQVSAKIDEAKAASDAIRAEIAVLNTQLDKIKAEREAANAKLDAMRAEQQEARSDIPGLMVEKKELWEVIQTLRDKQREIRVAFNEKWEQFKKQDKAWKGWFAQERKKRCAQWQCCTKCAWQWVRWAGGSFVAMLCVLQADVCPACTLLPYDRCSCDSRTGLAGGAMGATISSCYSNGTCTPGPCWHLSVKLLAAPSGAPQCFCGTDCIACNLLCCTCWLQAGAAQGRV
jgi:hypothetical protein